MAIEITGKFKPKNGKTFAIVDAADVEMPDGSRLSDFKGGVTSVNGQTGDVVVPAGEKGKDGVSPTVTVTDITGGHRVVIKDAAGTKIFDVMDGKDGGGASITVDSELSETSTNPVQNRVITTAFSEALTEISDSVEQLAGSIPTIDTTLSVPGQAADAGAVGDAIQQAMQEASSTLEQIMGAIPTEAQINALIDAKLAQMPAAEGVGF